MKRIVILGAPGAGKGTQSKKIVEYLNVPHLATGDMFRELMSGDSALGKQARTYIDQGQLVPDEIVNEMVRKRLLACDRNGGFLLDGYPRNLIQAHALNHVLDDMGVDLDAVIELKVDKEELIARLLKRAEIEGRSDDTEPVIRNRMEVYRRETKPITAFYETEHVMNVVDGMGTAEDVWARIQSVLDGKNS
ncbi:MAG: adenylate kinase [Actinomycetaceae bacterium]|nr:adenylate kinase [Actinomycetaceae bacterium]